MSISCFTGIKPPTAGVDASCLSQWFVRDFQIDGVNYPTAEHWMMAEKARLFDDAPMLKEILCAPGPREAKAFGRKVSGFEQDVWKQHRFEIVCRGNTQKFSQHKDLRQFLLSTASLESSKMVAEQPEVYRVVGSDSESDEANVLPFRAATGPIKDPKRNVILVEAAGRDQIWGIGLGMNNPKSRDPFQWRGTNLLGFALTAVRERVSYDQSYSGPCE